MEVDVTWLKSTVTVAQSDNHVTVRWVHWATSSQQNLCTWSPPALVNERNDQNNPDIPSFLNWHVYNEANRPSVFFVRGLVQFDLIGKGIIVIKSSTTCHPLNSRFLFVEIFWLQFKWILILESRPSSVPSITHTSMSIERSGFHH